MTLTSGDHLSVLYDRKSKRHSWQVYVASYQDGMSNSQLARCFYAACMRMSAYSATDPAWAGYQLKVVDFDTSETHAYPDTLPAYDQQGVIVYGGEVRYYDAL